MNSVIMRKKVVNLDNINKIKGFFLILIITFLGIFILRLTKNNDSLIDKETQPILVKTNTINLITLEPEYSFYGNVIGLNQIDIVSKPSGNIIKVSEKVFSSNEFKKGEIIFEIDSFKFSQELNEKVTRLKNLNNELKSARLVYKETETQFEINQKDFERKQKLYGDIITKKDLESAELNLSLSRSKLLTETSKIKSLEASIDIAQTQIKSVKRSLKDTKYKAPFDGKVYNSIIEIGTELTPGKIIGSFINTKDLNVEFFVGENAYTRLGETLNKNIDVIWKKSNFKNNYNGKVFYVDSAINQDRSGLNMKAKLENIEGDDPIRPGVFVEVNIKGKAVENAYLISEEAIYENKYVLILQKNIPIKRKVNIKGFIKDKVIVTGDISENENIILTRLNNINVKKKLVSIK